MNDGAATAYDLAAARKRKETVVAVFAMHGFALERIPGGRGWTVSLGQSFRAELADDEALQRFAQRARITLPSAAKTHDVGGG
ncbi:MAG: hypothetical protein K8R60_04480 [Burkholderiales bacterium]|nr:hypothetical protein [Burkholderiales bacterium]